MTCFLPATQIVIPFDQFIYCDKFYDVLIPDEKGWGKMISDFSDLFLSVMVLLPVMRKMD